MVEVPHQLYTGQRMNLCVDCVGFRTPEDAVLQDEMRQVFE